MNHKRKRAKHKRAGCTFCKPWKSKRGYMGIGPTGQKYTVAEQKRNQVGRDER